jgi:hypothetical protein
LESVNMNQIAAIGFLIICAICDVDPGMAQALPRSDSYDMIKMNDARFKDWLSLWERNILAENPLRYCSTEMGEELGWKMAPFLRGFYYGYLATGNVLWVERLVACTDAWIKRAVKEPDGYLGWPKVGAAGTGVDNLDDFYADSMLGEAMALTPVVLMAAKVQRTPLLKEKYGSKADAYIGVAEQIFEKWDTRGSWREAYKSGVVTVVLPFGIDLKTGNWTDRNAPGKGFSHPDNKDNLIAEWLLAMLDVTDKPIYRNRAEKWFQVMKSRMKLKRDDTYEIWNYWEPGGDWDYKLYLLPKHWVGVHPNPSYYDIDVEGIVTAYQHGLVFNKDDINRLVATAIAERRYWSALVPFDRAIQKRFEDTLDPGSWVGISIAPWYLAIQLRKAP